MNSSSNISALDFEIALGALRRITPLPTELADLRALARRLVGDLCPDKTCSDELVDAMVQAVASEPAAIRRHAAE